MIPMNRRRLRDLLIEDPNQEITVQGQKGQSQVRVEQGRRFAHLCRKWWPYFTFSDENNYQNLGILEEMASDNGWVCKGRDVMPWCTRRHRASVNTNRRKVSGSPTSRCFSDFANQRRRQGFPKPWRLEKEALLVWTTTPWTLSNKFAAAGGPELDYVKVQSADGWATTWPKAQCQEPHSSAKQQGSAR